MLLPFGEAILFVQPEYMKSTARTGNGSTSTSIRAGNSGLVFACANVLDTHGLSPATCTSRCFVAQGPHGHTRDVFARLASERLTGRRTPTGAFSLSVSSATTLETTGTTFNGLRTAAAPEPSFASALGTSAASTLATPPPDALCGAARSPPSSVGTSAFAR
eukprot:3067475-Pleurochrysis_carterae.AAC.5